MEQGERRRRTLEGEARELTLATPFRRFEYLWQDGVQYKKPTKLSAPGAFACFLLSKLELIAFAAYVDCLMNWVQGMLDDESIFPSKIGGLSCTFRSSRLLTNCLWQACPSPRTSSRPSSRSSADCSAFTRTCTTTISPSSAHSASKVSLFLSDSRPCSHLSAPLSAHINTSYRHFLLFVTEVRSCGADSSCVEPHSPRLYSLVSSRRRISHRCPS